MNENHDPTLIIKELLSIERILRKYVKDYQTIAFKLNILPP